MEPNCFGKKLFVHAKYFTCHSNQVQFKQWMSKRVTAIFSSQILDFFTWMMYLISLAPYANLSIANQSSCRDNECFLQLSVQCTVHQSWVPAAQKCFHLL